MKKNLLTLCGCLALLSACDPMDKQEPQNSPKAMPTETVVLYESESQELDPQRGLGSLANPRSTESVADPGKDREDELLPQRLYQNMNESGATLATF